MELSLTECLLICILLGSLFSVWRLYRQLQAVKVLNLELRCALEETAVAMGGVQRVFDSLKKDGINLLEALEERIDVGHSLMESMSQKCNTFKAEEEKFWKSMKAQQTASRKEYEAWSLAYLHNGFQDSEEEVPITFSGEGSSSLRETISKGSKASLEITEEKSAIILDQDTFPVLSEEFMQTREDSSKEEAQQVDLPPAEGSKVLAFADRFGRIVSSNKVQWKKAAFPFLKQRPS